MIICLCGDRNAVGSSFCGSCGASLEWEDEPSGSGRPSIAWGSNAAVYCYPPSGTVLQRTLGSAQDRAREFRPQRAGDLRCQGCGCGNATTRRFCADCGASLAGAPVIVPPSPVTRPSSVARPGRWLRSRRR